MGSNSAPQDSKLDQEKRTEKDFKERVAVMTQLYRALVRSERTKPLEPDQNQALAGRQYFF